MENKTKSKKADQNDQGQRVNELVPQTELWQSFHALVQHWQSDLKFFEDELNFFRLLIDKNLAVLIEPENIAQTRAMVSHVLNMEKERASLHEEILQHGLHIAQLVENPFVMDAHVYKSDHAKLEDRFANFVRKFRSIKSEVFVIAERVSHSEKMKRMIDWA